MVKSKLSSRTLLNAKLQKKICNLLPLLRPSELAAYYR
jgi:hypothetical protein